MTRFASASFVAVLAAATFSQASVYYNDFSSPVATASTPTPGAWVTDRAAPAGFQTSGGALIQTVAPTDYNPTNDFLNTQGRSYALGTDNNGNVQSVSIDLFIPSSWAANNTVAANKRNAGLWGAGYSNTTTTPGTETAYPILRFVNDSAVGVAGVYGYDYNTGLNSLPVIPNYDAYNTLSYTVTPGVGTSYYLNGNFVSSVADADTTFVGSVLLETKNFNSTYSATWDNLSAVPEPASLAVLGVGAAGLLMRRRRAAQA